MKRFILFLISVLLAVGLFFCTRDAGKTPAVGKQSTVVLKTVQPFSYVVLPHRGSVRNREKAIREFRKVLQAQNIQAVGKPFLIFYSNPQTVAPESLKWAIGVPLKEKRSVQPPLQSGEWEFTRVASYLYSGSNPENSKAYQRIQHFIQDKNLQISEPYLERYQNLPASTSPEPWQTDLWIPVQ